MRRTILISLLFLLLLESANAQTKNPTEKVNQLLEKYHAKNSPGLAVAIVKDGKIVYKKGVGLANLEYQIPITPQTVFHIASISKQFTLFSILLLEQENKLSLDDDIRKYLPEMKDFGHKITLRNLANHTSGIRDISNLMALIGLGETETISHQKSVELIIQQTDLNFIPGNQFEYSNSGYILLAEIVQRVSKQSFADFTKERIFKPLKMEHSFFLNNTENIIKNHAYSYYKLENTYYKNTLNCSFFGSTGLITSVEDLSLWVINFDKKTIGNEAIFNKMQQKSHLNNDEEISYALGQELKEYKGWNCIFHGGGIASYRSYLLRIPEANFAVIVESNDANFNPLDIVFEIVDFYLKNKTQTPATTKAVIDTSKFKSYIGDYEVFPGMMVSITEENQKLFLQIKGDTSKVALPATNTFEFTYPLRPHSKIVFPKDTKCDGFKWHFSDFVYNGKRVYLKPFDATTINLSELTGLYYNSELNTTYKMIIKDNALVATNDLNDNITLTPLQQDVFTSFTNYFGKVEVIRNEQGTVISLSVSGQGFKNMIFDKKHK
jgi:CubicO group peptidase (beta-lactamase class C family)